MEDILFTGLVVVIVNGGCNTGRSLAIGFAAREAKVVVHGPKHVVDVTIEEVHSLGSGGLGCQENPIEAAMEKFGRIDIVAIVARPSTRAETFNDSIERLVYKTYIDAMYGYTYLNGIGHGNLLIVVDYEDEGVAYATARKSLMGMCISLANESNDIKCNCILAVDKKARKNVALVVMALTVPPWGYSGCTMEVNSTLAQQLVFNENVSYTYSSSSPSVDQMLKSCLAMPSMREKVAIVTGAGSGLGLLVARRLVEFGARVVAYESNMMIRTIPQLVAIRPNFKRKESWVESILSIPEPKEKPKEERYVYINSMDEEEMVKTCISKFGRVDILINCPSIPTNSWHQDLVPFYFEMAIHHHIKASYRISQHVWPSMSKQKDGRIVNLIPMDQARPSLLSLGMAGLSQALAEKGIHENIHVTWAISSASVSETNFL
ncbi:bifunctional hydroxyacyl-CoA dehydrogenase/enoyl-CoA hydratase fox2 [Entomophthora muscae]|uniref:Bifunctional hydroxyacyl-CoA dehydrogenase/enoyl-CoA hydratase fox2 n=1 Tax=Entomophthora muscae TaxID=34485 RepID=A0ACC2UHI6_9FUNG|nr:bifunctional hydroxyacyl-CoA dehydrogenase/enoyl-CoA hydratase fox2 [Entomophthora muscae]